MKFMTRNHSIVGSGEAGRAIAIWLIICACLVFAMIVLGGLTRLTHSGLSMVDWQPLMGIIPPITKQDWLSVFAKYQLSPEYWVINDGMELGAFKKIFLMEYAHRVLGRLTGIVFIVPFIIFYLQRRVSGKLAVVLLLIFLLGGLQGGLGWYMVKSGLVDTPHVSQYRLVAHLALAVALFCGLLWLASSVVTNDAVQRSSNQVLLKSLILMIYVMILMGGLVAGLNAGLIWNTFPLFGDALIPPGIYECTPWYMAAFEDQTTAQFNHRLMAACIAGVSSTFCLKTLKADVPFYYKAMVLTWCLLIAAQILIGILTLIHVVPIHLAVLHQIVAVLILGGGVILLRISSIKY